MEANSRRQNAVRKARKLTAPVIEAIDRAIVYERDKGICGICRKPVDSDWHLDHIIPLSRSGEHSYANVQVSHSRCNLSKGATR
jgi:5-methylcytosine-specific restriction endonuclease McrA